MTVTFIKFFFFSCPVRVFFFSPETHSARDERSLMKIAE